MKPKIIKINALMALALFACVPAVSATMVIPIDEDVMTSGFFMGSNRVRGYAGDARPVFRVSNTGAFGVAGAETIYLTIDPTDLNGIAGPVNAVLTVESTAGGFGFDASAGSPFVVSAHAVNADPLASIIDDTNPGGTIVWTDFLDNNIIDADPIALTTISGFGTVTFDVSSIVNDWIDGTNTIFAIALTGKNDNSGTDFLHGFLNNSEAPGSSFLTVSAVPVPAAIWMLAPALAMLTRRKCARRV
ncbi:MAG: hypothetical protein AAF387_18680 [Pseudomonadota bacterium]